jgi:hypothetical protein
VVHQVIRDGSVVVVVDQVPQLVLVVKVVVDQDMVLKRNQQQPMLSGMDKKTPAVAVAAAAGVLMVVLVDQVLLWLGIKLLPINLVVLHNLLTLN